MTRRFLVDPPSDVKAKVDEYVLVGMRFQQQGQLEFAFEAYRLAWQEMLTQQPDGGRFHKGRELANMGGTRLQAGMMREGLRWMLYAFIEDCLSRAEDSESIRDELQWPASQFLRRFGFGEGAILGMADRIRGIAARQLVQDPGAVFVQEGYDSLLDRVREREVDHRSGSLTVFVSSPGDLRPERKLVAEVCRELATITQRSIRALLWEGGGARNPESPPFPPEVTGLGAQAVIDDRIRKALGGYDVYLGMIWRRMGTPTNGWRSGTEAELRLALDGYQREGRPRVWFYTKALRRPNEREPEAEIFVRELHTLGLTQQFRSKTELRRMLVDHLGEAVRLLT